MTTTVTSDISTTITTTIIITTTPPSIVKFNYNIHKPIIYSIVAVIAVFGVWGNTNLVVVHCRKRKLRNKYGSLLCILSGCQALCLIFEWLGITYSLTAETIKRSVCFPLLSPYVFTHCMQTGLLATISADLLISVVFPITHRILPVTRYIFVICIPTITYGLICLILGIIFMDNETLMMCNPPSSLYSKVNLIWYMGAMIAGGITIVNYMITFLVILYKNIQRNISSGRSGRDPLELEKKALRSITVILSVFVFSRYIGVVASTILQFFSVDPAIIALLQNYNVVFATICYSQNYYVCITTSSEYNKLLKEQLYLLLNNIQGYHTFHLPSDILTTVHISHNKKSMINPIPTI